MTFKVPVKGGDVLVFATWSEKVGGEVVHPGVFVEFRSPAGPLSGDEARTVAAALVSCADELDRVGRSRAPGYNSCLGRG